MSTELQRASFLLEQDRFDLAERELRQVVGADPDNAHAHSLLAYALSRQNRAPEALKEAKVAVGLAPDSSRPHYILALVYEKMSKHRESEKAVREAIRLNPFDTNCFALLAQILANQARWQETLTVAKTGLQFDSENVVCTNYRAMALNKLKRRDDAQSAIDTALNYDPENAFTHANHGWTLLEAGKTQEALLSFRESLRLQPDNDWAKRGIISALKARSPIYRIFLSYFFWMSRLPQKTRYAVIIGFVIGNNVLRSIAAQYPALNPFIAPIVGLYLVLVFFSWTADPLFNLLLRFDPVGRYVLSKRQITDANGVGICLATGLIALLMWLITRSEAMSMAGITSLIMVIPVTATLRASTKTLRWVFGVLTGLLGFVLTGGVIILGFDKPLILGIYAGLITFTLILFNWAVRRG